MINHLRIIRKKDIEYISGKVLYWMRRDMRMKDNWALLHAYNIAQKHNVELIVCYTFHPKFNSTNLRHLDFEMRALQELHQDFKKKNISFFIIADDSQKSVIEFVKKNKFGYIVTDFSPLREYIQQLNYFDEQIKKPIDIVDAHNIVPVWIASNKKEFSARTIRPKIQKKLKEFLTDFPKVKKQDRGQTRGVLILNGKQYDIKEGMQHVGKIKHKDMHITPITWCVPGEKSAHTTLKHFITSSQEYSAQRNNPNYDVQSQLSPYIHYGMIAPQRVAYEVLKSNMNLKTKKDFLEELIVRRELAENFCFYESKYDTFDGFHEFFKKELEKNKNVHRDYVYTKKEFEQAQTHDDLWNACQNQMIQTGKMHGYMRMYWAKMIYAWSKNAQEAIALAIYLNDTYEIDGRDPNGYTGIAWSIGGVHDRPWYSINPVFGKLRYMSRNGMKKKFDVIEYIRKWKK